MCGQLLPKMQIPSELWCKPLWSCSCTFWFLRAWTWLLDSPCRFILKWWQQGSLSHLSLCSSQRSSPSPTLLPPLGTALQSNWRVGNIMQKQRQTTNLIHQQSPVCTCCLGDILELSSKPAQRLNPFSVLLSWASLTSETLYYKFWLVYIYLIYFLELRGFGHDTVVQ